MTSEQQLALLGQGQLLVILAGFVFCVGVVVSLIVGISPIRDKQSGTITRAVALLVGVAAAAILLLLAWHITQITK
jgi:hypothetical protein